MTGYLRHHHFLRRFNSGRGFTVIELIVAAAIIGVLISVIVINFSTSRLKSRNAQRISDLQKIQLALEEYFDDHGYYPRCPSGSRHFVSNDNTPGSDVCEKGDGDFGKLDELPIKGYLKNIPLDPINASSQGIFYTYCYYRGYRKIGDASIVPTGLATDYVLAARLEDASPAGYGAPSGPSFSMCNRLYRNVLLGN